MIFSENKSNCSSYFYSWFRGTYLKGRNICDKKFSRKTFSRIELLKIACFGEEIFSNRVFYVGFAEEIFANRIKKRIINYHVFLPNCSKIKIWLKKIFSRKKFSRIECFTCILRKIFSRITVKFAKISSRKNSFPEDNQLNLIYSLRQEF